MAHTINRKLGSIKPLPILSFTITGNFFAYKSGVYFESNCGRTNPDYLRSHAAVVVGLGTDANYGEYWIVRKSCSESWGDNGYVHFARNRDNLCGIVNSVMYPVI